MTHPATPTRLEHAASRAPGEDPPLCECHGEEMYFNPDRRYRAGGFWRCREKVREYRREFYRRNGMKVRWQEYVRHHRNRLAELEASLEQGG